MKVSYYNFFFFFFVKKYFYKSHHATGWCKAIMEFFWNVITLYKPRMPSVLYIFMRASNIPLYCRLDGSMPALYCSTSRVLVTHIGFVMQRVMAPENRQKLLSLLCQLHRMSQFVQSNITQASTKTKLLLYQSTHIVQNSWSLCPPLLPLSPFKAHSQVQFTPAAVLLQGTCVFARS